jgi:gliding motility-associated-like protein
VPNPSFENISTCPNSLYQIQYATPWYSTTASTPDLFNSCCSIFPFHVDVPVNILGIQNARTGYGYAGVGTDPLDTNISSGNIREYISTNLTETLVAGRNYCIEFYVSLADSSIWAIDQIGASLTSTDLYDGTTIEFIRAPIAVESPAGFVINDSIGWYRIAGVYRALGGENYLTLGVFHPLVELTIDSNPNSWAIAYYYIDDVSVYACPEEYSSLNIPSGFSPNGDGVNDVFAASDTNLSFYSCKIYNRWGNLVFESNPSLKTWNGQYQGGDCAEGTYYYIIEAVGLDDKKYLKKGFLTLVR